MDEDPATDRYARRAGSALVECLVALAVAAAVFLPALAAVRAAVRADARAAARAEGAAAVRPAVRTAAARLRLGTATPELAVRQTEGGARVRTRLVPTPVDGADGAPGNGEDARGAESRAEGAAARLVSPPPVSVAPRESPPAPRYANERR